jgi:hypothetical protein
MRSQAMSFHSNTPTWSFGFDLDAQQAGRTRRRLLAQADGERAKLLGFRWHYGRGRTGWRRSDPIRAAPDKAEPCGLDRHPGDDDRCDLAPIRSLVEVFNNAKRQVVVRASSGKLPGHPVIIPKPLIDQLKLLDGDTGAQHIIRNSPLPVQMSNIGAAALTDVDTLEDAFLADGNIQTGIMSLSKTLPFPGRR